MTKEELLKWREENLNRDVCKVRSNRKHNRIIPEKSAGSKADGDEKQGENKKAGKWWLTKNSTKIHIRTRDLCQNCQGKFKLLIYQGEEGLFCENCLNNGRKRAIKPLHFYLDFYYQGENRKIYYASELEKPLNSYKIALAYAELVKQQITDGTFLLDKHRVRSLTSCREFFTYWLEQQGKKKERGQIAAGTYERFTQIVYGYFSPYFLDTSITEITEGIIQSFIDSELSSLAYKSKHSIVGILHKIFVDAAEAKTIAFVPKFPKLPKGISKPTGWITQDVQEKIMAFIPEEHKPIFRFLIEMGIRPSEARALQWQDIHFQQRTVFINHNFSGDTFTNTTKSKRGVLLPLPASIVEMLSKLQRKNTGFVFLYKGGPYSYRHQLPYFWNRAVEKAGLPYIRLYEGTRHSFASQKLNDGKSIALISKWLNHASVAFTQQIYAHASVEGLRSLIDDEKRPE